MGQCILLISVDEFYKLFFEDDGPFNFSAFFNERGDMNTTISTWKDPNPEY